VDAIRILTILKTCLEKQPLPIPFDEMVLPMAPADDAPC